jgi:hypothetical protein
VSSSAVVKKTRSPLTIGLEWPRPGTFASQRIFSVRLHFVTTCASWLLPSSVGPRHHGQSPSAAFRELAVVLPVDGWAFAISGMAIHSAQSAAIATMKTQGHLPM